MLKYLGAAPVRAQLEGLAEARVTFNYLGQFDQSFDEASLFAPAQENGGHGRAAGAPLENWLSVGGQVYEGELCLSFDYSRQMYKDETIEALARDYQAEIEAIVAHCLDDEAGGLTPSDVPLARLTQAQLDALPVPAREIEDVYPLSPMQQGMLFHALHTPEAGHYLNQLSVPVEGLDVARFKQAFAFVIARHAILRTSFVWDGDIPAPLQIVRKNVPLPVVELDWRDRTSTPQDIENLAIVERSQGFDLTQAPLQQMIVVRLDDSHAHLIWTHHHLLMDGWSTAREIEDVFAYYLGEPMLPASDRYRDYIAWLQQQDKLASERFWKEKLQTLDEPTLLVDTLSGGHRNRNTPKPDVPDTPQTKHAQAHARLSFEATLRLTRFSQHERVTLNTLVQGAWLLLLHRYCGQSAVAFGATVAGRPADLPGSEDMLGLFINTLPVIQNLRPEQLVGAWLRELQDYNLALREHEHVPLYDIQRWAGRPGQALFNSIIVFENYPIDQALRQRSSAILQFGEIGSVNPNNYALTVNVEVLEALHCTFVYKKELFEQQIIERLIDHWNQLLDGIAADASRPLADLELLTQDERAQIDAWSRGEDVPAASSCLHQLIEARVREQPDATAVIYEDASLTYRELNARANQLARYLRTLGVGPDVLVGLAVERSLEMVIGLLAILKAGGAYVPLDPSYPQERLAYMIEDAGLDLVLTQERLLVDLTRAQVQSNLPFANRKCS